MFQRKMIRHETNIYTSYIMQISAFELYHLYTACGTW